MDRSTTVERSRIAAAVYGTILVLAVVSYMSEDDSLSTREIAAAMFGTVFVYFVAHVYVDFLAERMTGAREGTFALTRRVLVEEWPLLNATLVPAVPLVMGAAGAFSRSTAVNLSLIVALVDLVGWGYAAGRRSYGSTLGGIVSAIVAIVLGAIVVGLKNLLH